MPVPGTLDDGVSRAEGLCLGRGVSPCRRAVRSEIIDAAPGRPSGRERPVQAGTIIHERDSDLSDRAAELAVDLRQWCMRRRLPLDTWRGM